MLFSLIVLITLVASGGLYLWTAARQKRASVDAEQKLRERDVALAQADDELTARLLADILSAEQPVLDVIRRWQDGRTALGQVSGHRRLAHAWTRAEARAELERRNREALSARQTQIRLRWTAAQGILLAGAIGGALIGYWTTSTSTSITPAASARSK